MKATGLSLLLLLLCLCGASQAQYVAVSGNCELPGQVSLTSGLPSSGTQPLSGSPATTGSGVMASYPQCLVTVYPAGSSTPVASGSIYSSATGSALGNPFTANTDGSWVFYAAAACYDIVISSGSIPSSQMPLTKTQSGKCAGGLSGAVTSITCESGVTCSPNPIVSTGTITGSGSGGGNPTLDNCTPDESGNSFYSVTPLTNYFYAAWEFCPSSFVSGCTSGATYINCTIYVPAAQTGATLVLDIATSDNSAGHTASFQTCDEVVNTGTINVGSALTCASAQTFTTTSTAYNRVSLTFNVQSTLSNGSMLLVKIATSTSGTAPTALMLVYPHFVL